MLVSLIAVGGTDYNMYLSMSQRGQICLVVTKFTLIPYAGMMWRRLSDQVTPWWEAENESYIYYNRGDGQWWIDGPDGRGLYIVEGGERTPPQKGWVRLTGAKEPCPEVNIVLDHVIEE